MTIASTWEKTYHSITVSDGTDTHYKDWAWRGHRRSSQPWTGNDMDTYADKLAALVEALDVRDAVHVGHSTGGREAARSIALTGRSASPRRSGSAGFRL
jgi:pimeloyl-ACP methyl ester carboxylesterase